MAQYKTCSACGANLDFGEKCECNGKGLPRGNGNSPQKNGSSTSSIVSQNSEDVKTEPLRELRISKAIPAKEMVEVVRELFPKYDKMLQSKCERSSEYGVRIRPEAMDALVAKYAPEELEKIKRKRRGGHRLTCRVTCRLEDAEYAEVVKLVREDGFDTIQAWLAFHIRKRLATRKANQSTSV